MYTVWDSTESVYTDVTVDKDQGMSRVAGQERGHPGWARANPDGRTRINIIGFNPMPI